MRELMLPIEVKTKSELLQEGLNRYNAFDREHPAARFFMQEDMKEVRAYEQAKLEQESEARRIGNLALQPTLDLSLDPVAA